MFNEKKPLLAPCATESIRLTEYDVVGETETPVDHWTETFDLDGGLVKIWFRLPDCGGNGDQIALVIYSSPAGSYTAVGTLLWA